MRKPSMVIKYEDDKGRPLLDVIFDGDTVWLTQDEIALLFETTRTNVVMHIQNIYRDEELDESTTCQKFLQVVDNKRRYYLLRYNLDVVISVGYRVKTKTATRFRQWATNIIRERVTGDYSVLAQEEALRLLTRVQVDDSTMHLVGVATTRHKVRDEASFLGAGDRGMYHMDRQTLEAYRKIPAGKLYDYVGSTELGMHVYRLTQTAEALSIDANKGYRLSQEEAEEVHSDISERTRMMSHLVHGQFPEDLPKARNIELVKFKHRALLRRKEPKKLDPSQEKLTF